MCTVDVRGHLQIQVAWRAVKSMDEIHAIIMQFLSRLCEVVKQNQGYARL